MDWVLKVPTKIKKSINEMPDQVRLKALALFQDLSSKGPMAPKWPNFSKLGDDKYHCHIKKGRPTYVACWIANKKELFIEVTYAGTHEKAPY